MYWAKNLINNRLRSILDYLTNASKDELLGEIPRNLGKGEIIVLKLFN